MRACTVAGPCWAGVASGCCACPSAGGLLLEPVLCARAPNETSEITARTTTERRKENIVLDLPPPYSGAEHPPLVIIANWIQPLSCTHRSFHTHRTWHGKRRRDGVLS